MDNELVTTIVSELRNVMHAVIYPALREQYGDALPDCSPFDLSIPFELADRARMRNGRGCFVCGEYCEDAQYMSISSYGLNTDEQRIAMMMFKYGIMLYPPPNMSTQYNWLRLLISACPEHVRELLMLEQYVMRNHNLTARVAQRIRSIGLHRSTCEERSDIFIGNGLFSVCQKPFERADTSCYVCGVSDELQTCVDFIGPGSIIENFELIFGSLFTHELTDDDDTERAIVATCTDHRVALKRMVTLIRRRRGVSSSMIYRIRSAFGT
ncbi:MAG: hypothetical protein ABIG71_03735 [Candidatus Uhrbacteria bacterium]